MVKETNDLTTTVKARFSHGMIEPLEKINFPEGKEFVITISEIPGTVVNLYDDAVWENNPFFTLAGIIKNGESDLSEEHDKYIYGQINK